MAKFPEAEARLLNVKICMHCNARNAIRATRLPQVWLPESSPKEQGKKSITFPFVVWYENSSDIFSQIVTKNTLKKHQFFLLRKKPDNRISCRIVCYPFPFLCILPGKCLNISLIPDPFSETERAKGLTYPHYICFIRPVFRINIDNFPVIA